MSASPETQNNLGSEKSATIVGKVARIAEVVNLVNSMLDVERDFWDLFFDFVPDETRRHLKAARKEKLLALRSLLDAKIKDLEGEDKKAGKRRAQKVKVE